MKEKSEMFSCHGRMRALRKAFTKKKGRLLKGQDFKLQIALPDTDACKIYQQMFTLSIAGSEDRAGCAALL
jgi:hypothetical protein